MEYFAIVTKVGLQKIAEAIKNGTAINVTQFCIGDGGGNPIIPDESQSQLVNQVWIGDVISYTKENNVISVSTEVPPEVGTFTVREMGIIDSDGDLFAVANIPDTVKDNGSGIKSTLNLTISVKVENASSIHFDIVSDYDMELSDTSANAVQNRIVTAALNEKVDKKELAERVETKNLKVSSEGDVQLERSASTSTYDSIKTSLKFSNAGFDFKVVSQKPNGETYTNQIKTSNSKMTINSNDFELNSGKNVKITAQKKVEIGARDGFQINEGGVTKLNLQSAITELLGSNGFGLSIGQSNTILEAINDICFSSTNIRSRLTDIGTYEVAASATDTEGSIVRFFVSNNTGQSPKTTKVYLGKDNAILGVHNGTEPVGATTGEVVANSDIDVGVVVNKDKTEVLGDLYTTSRIYALNHIIGPYVKNGSIIEGFANIDLAYAGTMCFGVRNGGDVTNDWRNFIELSYDGGINAKASEGMHIYSSDDLGIISDYANIIAAGYVGNNGAGTAAPTTAYMDVQAITFNSQVVDWDTFKKCFSNSDSLRLFAGGDMYLVAGYDVTINAGSGYHAVVSDNGTIKRRILNSNGDNDEYIEEIGVGGYKYRSYTDGDYLVSALENIHLVPGNTGGINKKSSDGVHYVYTSNLRGEGNGPNGMGKPIISNYAEIRAQNFVENGINLADKYQRKGISLPFGICSSGGNEKKEVTIPGFEPTNNCYFWIVFTEDNTNEAPLLNINNGWEFDIYEYESYGDPFKGGFKTDLKANVLYLAFLDDADSGTYYLIDVIETFKSTGVAQQLANKRYINGVPFDGTRNVTNFAVATKALIFDDSDRLIDVDTGVGFSLINGACIKIYFDNVSEIVNADPVYLNVNGTGAKPIYYNNKPLDINYFTNYHIYEFVYVNGNWIVVE